MNTPVKIQLGEAGLGVGGKPEKGKEAAELNLDEIRSFIRRNKTFAFLWNSKSNHYTNMFKIIYADILISCNSPMEGCKVMKLYIEIFLDNVYSIWFKI